jgi:hypothetical protein
VKTVNDRPLLNGVVRLLELVDLSPHQLHLLHLTMYYAHKSVSMISNANGSRTSEQSKQLRAERDRCFQCLRARVLLLRAAIRPPHVVCKMLTLMFMLVRSAGLGLEFGAHLLEELSQTSAWRCLPRRAHTAMRVVHGCPWLRSTRRACRECWAIVVWLAVCGPDHSAPSALSLVARPGEGRRAIGGSVDPMRTGRGCRSASRQWDGREIRDDTGY